MKNRTRIICLSMALTVTAASALALMPASGRIAARGSAARGSAAHGSAVHGSAAHGAAVHGSAAHGAAVPAVSEAPPPRASSGDRLSVSESATSLGTFAIGPGVVNLSPADQFATYQWGLKNDGELQLIEMKAKFHSADSIYTDSHGGKDGLGLPALGPGDFESTVTNAVAGIDINIRPAWDLYDQTENRRPVTVAIIDTGVDISHPEFSNAMWTNPGEIPDDGIDNDGNGFVDDIHGWNFYSGSSRLYVGKEDSHGTHAAGTVAAARGDSGIAGITDNSYVKIMSLKALGGSDGTGSPDSVIQAIRYAEANGASICNLSMGTSFYNEELAATIQNSGMLFVVACGNGGITGLGYDTDAWPVYPASFPYDNIISVANLLFDGNLSRDSNYGAVSVDIAAPGTCILSTLPDNNYGFMSGTSMAAPMVTGVAAMLYSCRPDISLSDIRGILINSSRRMDQLNGKTVSGGLLDAYAALTYQ